MELPSSEARDFTVNSLFFVFVQYDLVVSAYSMLELPSSEARIAEINSLWSRYSSRVIVSGLNLAKSVKKKSSRIWTAVFGNISK